MIRPTGKQIASRDNPLYKSLRALLASASARRKSEAIVLEGVHLAQAWLDRGHHVQWCVTTEAGLAHPEIAPLVARVPDAARVLLSEPLYRGLSLLDQGTTLLLIAAPPTPELPARIDGDCVVLDRIQDAGNVGSLLRSAAAAGVATALCVTGTASAWSPKALRAGMGAQFALSIHEGLSAEAIRERLAVPLLAAAPGAAKTLYDTDLRAPCAWVMGSEGQGLDAGWLAAATPVSIPQTDRVESLNVAAAAAVCLFEMRRQRLIG